MDGLVRLAGIGTRLTVLIFFLGSFGQSIYVLVYTDGSPTLALLWLQMRWVVGAILFLLAWVAMIYAIYGVRRTSEAFRCWRVQRSGRPFVILSKDRVDPYIDGLLAPMHRRWPRGIQFEGEMGRWCRCSMAGSYRVSKPLFSGGRIITFSNPDDAFAFKMRWA